MNRLTIILLALLGTATASAQLGSDGFYRVQNTKTSRYLTFIDNKGGATVSGMTATYDTHALHTEEGFATVVADPASVIYIKKATKGYRLECQGANTDDLIAGSSKNISFTIAETSSGSGVYRAGGSYGGVASTYLIDASDKSGDVTTGRADSQYATWWIKPISATNDENYFGIRPTVTVGNKHYASFYADFAFRPASAGMTCYYVTLYDETRGIAVISPIDNYVPKNTPCIVECSSTDPADNRVQLLEYTTSGISGNKLSGLYFNFVQLSPTGKKVQSENRLANTASTTRTLGVNADGELALVYDNSISYVPANSAYLKVSSTKNPTIRLMSLEDYAAGISTIEADASSLLPASRRGVFTIGGQRIATSAEALDALAPGIYVIDGRKVVVR